MGLRVQCDRCGTTFDPIVDEDAARVSLDQMTEDWQIEGSSTDLGDFCGACIQAVRAFCKRVTS